MAFVKEIPKPIEGHNGVRLFYVEDSEKAQIVHCQDVTSALEHNKTMQNCGDGGWMTKDKSMRRMAHIPDGVILKWLHEHGVWIYDKEALPWLMKKLNDPDWAYLKTIDGRVG